MGQGPVIRVEAVLLGAVRTFGTPGATDPLTRPWTSAIRKEPASGPVWAGREGLSGDHQYDRRHHGGPDRAVLMYAAEHYPRWRAEWARREVGPGAFGENLTVTWLDEHRVCLGDVFGAGEVRLEVSSPRSPCQNLVRLHGMPDLVRVVQENHRSGWYLRVRHEGWIEAGMTLTLLDRPYPQWTVARAATVRRHRHERAEDARLLAACPALIEDWRTLLAAAATR